MQMSEGNSPGMRKATRIIRQGRLLTQEEMGVSVGIECLEALSVRDRIN